MLYEAFSKPSNITCWCNLCNLELEWRDSRSTFSSLVEFPTEHKTDISLHRTSSFGSIVWKYVRLPGILSIPNSFIKQSM